MDHREQPTAFKVLSPRARRIEPDLVKTHTTALALVPPQDVWEPIQEIRRRHDRQVRRWMPHLNLLYPFRPRAEFEAMAEPLAAALLDFAPFEVRLGGFRHFEHRSGSCTLWLDPQPADRLEPSRPAFSRSFRTATTSSATVLSART